MTKQAEFTPINQDPPCQYYGECGGCALQHISNSGEYKFASLKESLKAINFNGKLHALYQIETKTRRRVSFKVRNQNLCFNKLQSKETVNITNCLLLTDPINDLIKPINRLLKQIKIKIDSVSITNSDTGIEILLSSATARTNLICENLLTEFAKNHNIGRIAWQIHKSKTYTIIQFKPIALKFGNIYVNLPINSFLQVSKESNAYMSQVILDNLEAEQNILELYCGVGSFTIPIQQKARVTAIEGNDEAIKYLLESTKNYNLAINALNKDLYQTPCDYEFINKFKQVVINPPRNGATPQIKQISLAKNVKKVILVSCSVENFIRDAKILLQANFSLTDIYPIDQFLYSHHLELIAIFKPLVDSKV